MAKEIRIKMDIEGNAVDSLKNIQKAYDDINKSAENAKKATEGIAGSPAIKPSVGADMNLNPTGKYYKQQQRKDREEMLSMAMAGDTTSESFIKLQEKTGNLRDTQDELNNRLKYFAQSGAEQAATALAEGVGVLGSTAQIAIGSMELLGISNEEATKTVAKLASVEAVMNGVKQISIALQSDSMFMLGLENAKMKALAFTTSAYNTVVGSSIGLLKGMKLALAGTGIGLAIVAVGALASAYMDMNDAQEKSLQSEKDIDDQRSTNAKNAEEYSKRMIDSERRLTVELLRAKGKNAEANALEKAWQETDFSNAIKTYNTQKKIVDEKRKLWEDEQNTIKEREERIKDPNALLIGGQGYIDQYKKQTEQIKQQSKNTLKELNEDTKILNASATAINMLGKQNQLSQINNKNKVSSGTVSKQKLETVQASAPKNFTLNIAELGRIDQVNIMSDEDEKAFQQRLVNAVMSAMTTAQARVAR